MTVTNVRKDRVALTLTLTAEFDSPVERVWRLWEDPRQLERWWGPPSYPATFVDHDLTAGGTVTYYMTGPEGDQPRGWWRIIDVAAPHRLEFEDGFADANGNPDPGMPIVSIKVSIEEKGAGGTRMTIESSFPSLQAMEQLVEMGMEEGLTQAVEQIDALLTEGEHPDAGN